MTSPFLIILIITFLELLLFNDLILKRLIQNSLLSSNLYLTDLVRKISLVYKFVERGYIIILIIYEYSYRIRTQQIIAIQCVLCMLSMCVMLSLCNTKLYSSEQINSTIREWNNGNICQYP